MKFNEKWLREWINPKINSTDLIDQIIQSGIEVESVDNFNPIFNGFLVGEIIECVIHPKVSKLKIVKVDIGKKNYLKIVCGALNCRNNIKVVVATIDSMLPNGLKIKIKKIQDQKSEGMLCSFFELGLFNFSKNIIEISQDIPVGKKINDIFSLKDTLIKVSTTLNRPDGLSILGIARNLSAINNLSISSLKKINVPVSIMDQYSINISIQEKNIKFFGRIIKDVNINIDTPFWMKKKLFFCDLLSENIIENILNYVLIEIGQPLNALNADKINNSIYVRMAKKEEFLILENKSQITLDEDILVFSDKEKILFIPGNINSYPVVLNKNSKNIFLSSYLVEKENIFNILKKVNFNSILDYHSHGIDSSLQKYALEYATDLIIRICGGQSGPITTKKSNFNSLSSLKKIKLYHQNFNKCVGFSVDSSIILNILSNLQYKVDCQEKYWYVSPPSWRFDILIEEDVIGDILRIYNYNCIPLNPLKENFFIQSNEKKKRYWQDLLLDQSAMFLIHRGYYEAINYSFVNPDLQYEVIPNKNQLLINNPISKDFSSMRTSLFPGLLKTVSYNKNRQQDNIQFFERGFCFLVDQVKKIEIKQEMFLGAVISGFSNKENWYSIKRKSDFYDIKGDLESLLEVVYGLDNFEIRYEQILGLHPEQSAKIYIDNKYIGKIGKIHPKLEKKLNLDSATFLFEISFSYIAKLKSLNVKKVFKIEEVSKFPISRRDISILVPNNVLFIDIIKTCENFFSNKKVEINLFDVYKPQEEFHQKKSLGISFIFQSDKKTLKEDEINLMLNGCITILKNKFQVDLRR